MKFERRPADQVGVQRMFSCCSPQPVLEPANPAFTGYFGAGFVFTDNLLILCGWEPRKQRPGLYGIGGKAEPTDGGDYRITAARETLEELFAIKPSRSLLLRVAALKSVREELVGGYVMIYHTFATLQQLIRLVRPPSPFYLRNPITIEELIFKRFTTGTAEVAQLCLLPVTRLPVMVSADLVDDIRRLSKQRSPIENGQ